MPHETVIKVKHKGVFVNTLDLPAIKYNEQQRARAVQRSPRVNIRSLPEKSKLDDEVPFEQLCYEHPEVRAYITEEGKIRKGLSAKDRKKAEDILKKYGVEQ